MLPGLFAYQQAFVNFDYGTGAAMILVIVAVLLVVAVAYVLITKPPSDRRLRRRRERADAARNGNQAGRGVVQPSVTVEVQP
jgi:hypothetical protein